jgi:hypothetical protein
MQCDFILGEVPKAADLPGIAVTMANTLHISARTADSFRDLLDNVSFVQAVDWANNVRAGTITARMLDQESQDTDLGQLLPRRKITPP